MEERLLKERMKRLNLERHWTRRDQIRIGVIKKELDSIEGRLIKTALIIKAYDS